jgi:hypothetical protein
VGRVGGEEVAQTVYRHVSKCKSDKRKEKKKILKEVKRNKFFSSP